MEKIFTMILVCSFVLCGIAFAANTSVVADSAEKVSDAASKVEAVDVEAAKDAVLDSEKVKAAVDNSAEKAEAAIAEKTPEAYSTEK